MSFLLDADLLCGITMKPRQKALFVGMSRQQLYFIPLKLAVALTKTCGAMPALPKPPPGFPLLHMNVDIFLVPLRIAVRSCRHHHLHLLFPLHIFGFAAPERLSRSFIHTYTSVGRSAGWPDIFF